MVAVILQQGGRQSGERQGRWAAESGTCIWEDALKQDNGRAKSRTEVNMAEMSGLLPEGLGLLNAVEVGKLSEQHFSERSRAEEQGSPWRSWS